MELEYVQRIIDSTEGKEKELWENIKEIGQSGRRTGVGLCGLGEYDGYCAFREVPEWTEEDSKFINPWLNNVKCLQEKLGNEEIMALRTLKKLCKLARVEVEG